MTTATALAAAALAGPGSYAAGTLLTRRGFASRPWLVIIPIALGVALATTTASASPVGSAALDALERSLLIGAVTVLARRCPPALLLALGVVITSLTLGGLAGVLGAGAVGILAGLDPPARWARAAVGAAVGFGALTLPDRLGSSRWLLAGLLLATVAAAGVHDMNGIERRRLRNGALVAALGIMIVGAIAGIRLASVVSDARAGERSATAALKAMRDGDAVGARSDFLATHRSMQRASDAAGSPLVAPLRLVPIAAQHLRLLDRVARLGLDLSSNGAAAAAIGDPSSLAPRQGRVDLDRIRAMAAPAEATLATVRRGQDDLRRLRSPYLAPPISATMDDAVRQLGVAAEDLETASLALGVAPDLLGGGGTRRIFVGFTAPSELRGSQGIVGSYAELEATEGVLRLTAVGRDDDLNTRGVRPDQRQLEAPAGYRATWGEFEPQRTWQNITMSPDYPAVGQAIASLYPQSGGRPVDAVFLVDPAGVASLLRLVGPVTVDGWPEPISATNAIRILGIDQYARFATNDARVAFLGRLTRAAFERVLAAPAFDLSGSSSCLETAAGGRHVLAWSPRPREELLFDRAGLSGALPNPSPATEIVSATINNATGAKLDWFLQHNERVTSVVGPDGTRVTTLTVDLVNTAPRSGYPDYVLVGQNGRRGAGPGDSRLLVSAHALGELVGATLDDKALETTRTTEAGFGVDRAVVEIPAGRTATVRLAYRVAARAADAASPAPLIAPNRLSPVACG